MKTVFKNDMVAHVWAQQNQPEGRNAGKSIFFENETIYSYGTHFPMARFVTNAANERAVLFNIASYSITTSQHQSGVRSAIPHDVPVFRVPHVYEDRHIDNFRSYETRLVAAIIAVARARNASWKMVSAEELATEANAYATFFGLAERVEVPTWTPEFIAATKQKEKEREAAKREQRKQEAAAKAARLAQDVADWRAGAINGVRYFTHDVTTMLRVTRDGRTVQTSRGVEVPADDARKLFALILAVRERGEPWQRNGSMVRIGQFQADHISEKGDLDAGCHHIEWPEIEACAQLLGVADVAPSMAALEVSHS